MVRVALRSFLLFNDLTQLELAKFLNISKSQMSKLVSACKLQVEQLQKILANENGWNTEFLTNQMWIDFESRKQVPDISGIAIQQNGMRNQVGIVAKETSGEVVALRKENEMLRQQLEEAKEQKERYWTMIEKLAGK